MKRIAHIQNGQITNVSLAQDSDALPTDGSRMLEEDALAAGMTYARQTGTAPETITPRQLRLWLLSRGVTAFMVENAIAALPSPQRETALVEWEYALDFRRGHPLVQQLAAALGFDTAALETGWELAAEL